MFSEIGKAPARDAVSAICPDGSQYRVLMGPRGRQSFLFVQGSSLNRPLVVTLHSLTSTASEDHIYLANAYSGALTPIPKMAGQQVMGALSPDGSHVAYESVLDPRDPPRLFVGDIKTGQTIVVPAKEGEFYESAVWSPDGTELMFVSLRRGQGATPVLISLMRAASPFSNVVEVFGSDDLVGSSAYAPDGKRFAIWSVNGLEIVDRNTLARSVVFPTHSLDAREPGTAGLIWAKHSSTLAFTLFNLRTSASELWAVKESGKDARMIFSSRDGSLYVGSFVDQ